MGRYTRIMALDIGTKYIGIAITDPLLMTAQGLDTVVRTVLREDINKIIEVINKFGVECIVVGHPISDDGSENTTSKMVLSFVKNLRKKITYSNKLRLSPDIILWSERFSTQDANLILEEAQVKKKHRKKYLDKLSAVMILESYVNRRNDE